LQCSN